MLHVFYQPILEQIFLLLMSCVALLASAFARFTHQKHVYYLVQFSLLATIALYLFTGHTFIHFNQWPHVANDSLAALSNILICLIAWVILVYSKPYVLKYKMPLNEYCTLVLFAVFGMSILTAAHNLLLLYLGLELLALSTYVLIAIRRHNAWAIEAALKYFILGAIASGMLLYGISMVFGITGSLNIDIIAHYQMIGAIKHNELLMVGLVLLLAGTSFKLGIVPFQMWVPDVYQGAPAPITAFLATVPKIATLVLMIRLFFNGLYSTSHMWSHILITFGILSLIVGNIAALRQSQIKRLLAYSSIAQMGYVVLAFACGTPKGIYCAYFYMLSYIVPTLVMLGCLSLLSKQDEEIIEIKSISGLYKRYPWISLLMMMSLFSMAGIPPFIGFIGKLTVIEALISAHLTWVAVIAILFAIVGAVYYLRLIKVIYFDKLETHHKLDMTHQGKITLSINALLILVLGIWPNIIFMLFSNF